MQVPAHFLAQNASDFSCIWGENRNLAPGGCSWGFCCLGMPNPMTGPENAGEGILRGGSGTDSLPDHGTAQIDAPILTLKKEKGLHE